MADFSFILAKLLGKSLRFILSFIPWWGGGAAPGLLALKIDPCFIAKQTTDFKTHILISGTNGKTTTARMISSLLSAEKIKYIHNRSGSNLLRGVASTLLENSRKLTQKSTLIGLWEIDEAVLPLAVEQIKPQVVVLTNLFRDQLDRYGEIDALASKWLKALKNLPKEAVVVLNGDDASLINLGKNLKCQILFFGIKTSQILQGRPTHAADATFCPICLKPLAYQQVFYSHLGRFSCTCGFGQPQNQIQAASIKQESKSISFYLESEQKKLKIKLPLTGLFNIYNALAALTAAKVLKLDLKKAQETLTGFKPAFGRMEVIKAQNKTLNLLLVKNPTGFNQVIKTLEQKKRLPVLLIAINDNLADGTDISWLWDVDFEALKAISKKLIVSGTRAFDMALRLKYAGFNPKTISLITPDLKKALSESLKTKAKQIYILPTYTAMLKTRDIFNQWGIVHSSWKD